MLVLQTNSNIGDALCAMPAIYALAERKEVHLAMHCKQVAELIDHPNVKQVWDAPLGSRSSIVMGLRDVVDEHPTAVSMKQAGLAATSGWRANPWLKLPPVEEAFIAPDIVICPFTRDEVMRGWNDQAWIELISSLLESGREVTLAISGDDRRTIKTGLPEKLLCGLHLAVGLPLMRLAQLLAHARCVVTVDSMANRLCHAVGVPNQVLLLANCVTPTWGTWAGVSQVLYGGVGEWSMNHVQNAIKLASKVKDEDRIRA